MMYAYLLFAATFLVSPTSSEDGARAFEKNLWTNLIDDLMMETMSKIRQLDQVKEDHNRYYAFEAGWMIGVIREKYRAMLESYREIHAKHTKRNFHHGPNITEFRQTNYFYSMERIRLIEMEADQLIQLIERLPDKVFKKTKVRTAADSEPFEPDNDAVIDEQIDLLEKLVKNRNKENYILKQMGLPANATLPRPPSSNTKEPSFYDYDNNNK